MALILEKPRSFSAVAASDTRVWMILKEHFDNLLQHSPASSEVIRDLVSSRISDLEEKRIIEPTRAARWASKALEHFDTKIVIPTESPTIQVNISLVYPPLFQGS